MAARPRIKKPKFQEQEAIPQLLPKTPKQAEYIKALNEFEQVVALGPAGTGKSYVPSVMAATLLHKGLIRRVILTRPNVPAGRTLGLIPGTMEEKFAPWAAPVIEIIQETIGKGALETHIKNANIVCVPFETMRGLTFNDSFVILDEAQNTSPAEMAMFLTRIGENSRVVISGDISQSDIKGNSGLHVVLKGAKEYGIPVGLVEFSYEDIVRSELCKMWVQCIDDQKRKGSF